MFLFSESTKASSCVLRITSLGGTSGSSSCKECNNLVEEGEDGKSGNIKETKADYFYNEKSKIPGLDHEAAEKSTDDKNLAPFSLMNSKTFQYGDTSFISTNTDHPDWAPGECLNLYKYEGNFRITISGLTQQVNYYDDSNKF
jgi:hypothetical protein